MGLRRGQRNAGTIKKGEVRNPTGSNAKVKATREFKNLWIELGEDEIDFGGKTETAVRACIRACYLRAIKGEAAYAQLVAAYVFGKPTERTELSGPDGKPLTSIVILPSNALDAKP